MTTCTEQDSASMDAKQSTAAFAAATRLKASRAKPWCVRFSFPRRICAVLSTVAVSPSTAVFCSSAAP